MKISQGLEENGIVIGNTYDKYGSQNPIVQHVMNRFGADLSALVATVAPSSIHDIGCGEGFWVIDWNAQGIRARGTDFSQKVIGMARENAKRHGLSPALFTVRNIYELDPKADAADLIVCCEVLEHLEKPAKALSALQRTATDFVILSVPREPIWRILNLLRGKYINQLGNTPGHLQHWSSKAFVELVHRTFEVLEVRRPFPWTMLLCRTRP